MTESTIVSLQAALDTGRKTSCINLAEISSKKRKWESDHGDEEEQGEFVKERKVRRDETEPTVDLQLDTPLPLEWQRCLDIKSGQIHFYNTRTHKRTSEDPRQRCPVEPPMSLDLELNLACEPRRISTGHVHDGEEKKEEEFDDLAGGVASRRSLSWAVFEDDQKEMVAAVCMRCHMLVMMSKASPSCPNCKFVHPLPNQSSPAPALLKPGFRLLCCKD